MPIKVVCPGCQATFNAPDGAAGRKAACPKCSSAIRIEAAPAPSAASRAHKSAAAAGSPPAAAPGPGARPSATKSPTTKNPAAKKPAPKPAANGKAAAQLTADKLVAAVGGPIDPVRPTLMYRVGILLSLITMLLLPLVYLALIGAACYAVYYHAVSHTGMMEGVRGRGALLVLLAYLAPIIAGPVMILFMIKPIFARPSQHQKTRSLRRESEPVLFAFVDKICETVRSPKPKRIDIDCQVNASASFRKGMLSMLGNDLVLTVGMPLVAGMSVRQLGGVLAHEFGHFTQGAGMRLTYIVRTISHWFVRVVYERDEWDEWLHAAAGSVDIRIGWVLWLSILAVWITRQVLWVLLKLGMAVAGFTLRQMEFDADRYEARFAGSDTFAATARRLQQLNAGMQMAYNQLGGSHREGRLVDDLPSLVQLNAGRLPDQVSSAIEQAVATGRTGLFDTHPCDRDRIASAAAEQAAGVVTIDAPAAALFTDFEAQSKATTWEFYRDAFGNSVKKSALEPIQDLVAANEKEEEGGKRAMAYFLGTIRGYRAVPIRSSYLTTPESPKAVAEQLKAARVAVEQGAPDALELLKRRDKAHEKLIAAFQYEGAHKAGLRLDKKSVEREYHTIEKCRGVRDSARRTIGAVNNQLEPFDTHMAERMFAALELLQVEKVASRLDEGAKLRKRADATLPVLVAIDGQMSTLSKLFEAEVTMGIIVQSVQGQPDEQMVNAVDSLCDRAHPLMTQVREVLLNQQYPFDHKEKGISVGSFVLPTPPHRRDLGAVVSALPELTHRVQTVRQRAIGELVTIAEQVEAVLGLKPLREFEPDKPEEQG